MPLPAFDNSGDLPEGVYRAALEEVVARFGHGTPQRQLVTARLKRIYIEGCAASSKSLNEETV